MIYIIEHLEPEVWPWCVIEYKHISQTVGKENLWFTNVSKKDESKLIDYGKVINESVRGLKLDKVCVLDPESDVVLNPSETKKFDYMVFGGILGDHPPKKRTKVELTEFLPNSQVRNIGKEQMSTDNAVYVVHEIVGGKKFEELEFVDGIDVPINDVESVGFPFRYALVRGKPFISKELVEFLKHKEGF